MYVYILLEVSLENFDDLMVTFEKQKFKKKVFSQFLWLVFTVLW